MPASILQKLTLLTFLILAACTEQGQNTTSAQTGMRDLQHQAEEYVGLVLALGQHDSGYVDAYYGPPEWAEQALQNAWSAAEIAGKAEQLRLALSEHQANDDQMLALRLHFLDRNLIALQSHANAIASGTRSGFDQQTRELYDTEPPQRSLSDFDATLAQLETLIPGDGDLRDRLAAYRDRFNIPADKLDVVFQRAIQECRERSSAYIDLPAHENFTLEFVQDKPWGGYNWYQGNAFSLIQVNTDLPIAISRAVDLGCHEGYPGHHAFNTLLEEEMVNQRGWVEFSVYPLFSPQSLIAEGTANYGVDMAFPGTEKLQFERDVLYPLAGIDPAIADGYTDYSRLLSELSYADNEIARQYIDGVIDAEQAVQMSQRYALRTEASARQRIRFYDTYGAYVINYNWGKDLVRAYIEQTDDHAQRWELFKNLISSPRVPSSLAW